MDTIKLVMLYMELNISQTRTQRNQFKEILRVKTDVVYCFESNSYNAYIFNSITKLDNKYCFWKQKKKYWIAFERNADIDMNLHILGELSHNILLLRTSKLTQQTSINVVKPIKNHHFENNANQCFKERSATAI
jgi:hypothetical protein